MSKIHDIDKIQAENIALDPESPHYAYALYAKQLAHKHHHLVLSEIAFDENMVHVALNTAARMLALTVRTFIREEKWDKQLDAMIEHSRLIMKEYSGHIEEKEKEEKK